jgi:hypothetical protein
MDRNTSNVFIIVSSMFALLFFAFIAYAFSQTYAYDNSLEKQIKNRNDAVLLVDGVPLKNNDNVNINGTFSTAYCKVWFDDRRPFWDSFDVITLLYGPERCKEVGITQLSEEPRDNRIIISLITNESW